MRKPPQLPVAKTVLIGAAVALSLWAGASTAQDKDPTKIIKSNAYSTFGQFKYDKPFDHLDYVNPDAPKGGEISIWAQGTFDSMMPFSRKGRAGTLSSVMIEDILTDTADDPYGSYCLLCTHMEYPETEDWVIFHLRDDIRFSDGTPATAHDVVFSVDIILEQGLPSFREGVKKLYEKVEALDDYRVKFTFKDGVPRKNLIVQAGGTPLLSKAWFEKTGSRLDEGQILPLIGTGPYIADEVDPGRKIIYRRNPDYWGYELPINKGRHNFDAIRVEYFADNNAALEAFKAGVYTFRSENSSLAWSQQYDFPAIDKGWVVKAELHNGLIPAANGFVFNLRREKWQDLRVREAIGLMFNFAWTNETLQYDLFEQRQSFWENSDLAASGPAEGLEREMLEKAGVPVEVIDADAVIWPEGSERQLDRRAVRRASALLDEAGWETGDDGIRRNAAGKTLSLELLSDSTTFDRIILPFVENLQRLGVDATYNRVDPAQYTNRERDFDFDMIYDGYRNGFEEGIGILQKFGSEDAPYSVFNPAGYGSPQVDMLITEVIDATTLEEMQSAVRAIDRVIRHERFVVPTWYNPNFWVAYWDMYEHPDPLPPLALGYLDFWWYNAEKAQALQEAGAL